jgi:ATP-dependent Clp protease protease subunit
MKHKLPELPHLKTKAMHSDTPASALARWQPTIHAAHEGDINIYSSVGDYGDGGMTAKIVSAVLRNKKDKDVYVNINSPGGDFFEGVAIYNLLREYKGSVRVRVVGMAASAASIIAMAGDEVEIAESAFLMIHNAWTVAIGNKEDMTEVAAMLEKFDESMNGLYAKRTGMEAKAIAKMMDNETWLSGKDSVEMGFADRLLASDMVEKEAEDTKSSALRTVDVALAKEGMPRSKRRELLKEITGTPSAAQVMPSADNKAEILGGILEKLKTL